MRNRLSRAFRRSSLVLTGAVVRGRSTVSAMSQRRATAVHKCMWARWQVVRTHSEVKMLRRKNPRIRDKRMQNELLAVAARDKASPLGGKGFSHDRLGCSCPKLLRSAPRDYICTRRIGEPVWVPAKKAPEGRFRACVESSEALREREVYLINTIKKPFEGLIAESITFAVVEFPFEYTLNEPPSYSQRGGIWKGAVYRTR